MRNVIFFILMILIVPNQHADAALGDIIKSFAAPNVGSAGLTWDGTNLWYSDEAVDMIYKVNPADGSVLNSFPAASVNPRDLTFVGSDLWNADIFQKNFYSVDPTVGPPGNFEFQKAGQDYTGLEYDGSYLWGATLDPVSHIDKMDLSGNVISSFLSPSLGTSGLAWDGTYLWNADTNTDMIYKLDPSTGAIITSFAAPANDPMGLAFDGQYLWSTDNLTNQIYQLDACYAAPVGPIHAPPGIVSMLTMLASLGGWAGIGKLRGRIRKAKHST